MSLHARRKVVHPPFSNKAQNGSPTIEISGWRLPGDDGHTNPKSTWLWMGPNDRPENSFVSSGWDEATSYLESGRSNLRTSGIWPFVSSAAREIASFSGENPYRNKQRLFWRKRSRKPRWFVPSWHQCEIVLAL